MVPKRTILGAAGARNLPGSPTGTRLRCALARRRMSADTRLRDWKTSSASPQRRAFEIPGLPWLRRPAAGTTLERKRQQGPLVFFSFSFLQLTPSKGSGHFDLNVIQVKK